MRQCGDCTLCCKLLGVHELNKPHRVYCPHCAIGQGCKIYETRPKECIDFRCAWLDELLPEELKPNKTGVMITNLAMELKEQGYQAPKTNYIMVYPEYSDSHKSGPMKDFLNDLLAKGVEIIVVDGEKKMLMKWGKVEDGDSIQ